MKHSSQMYTRNNDTAQSRVGCRIEASILSQSYTTSDSFFFVYCNTNRLRFTIVVIDAPLINLIGRIGRLEQFKKHSFPTQSCTRPQRSTLRQTGAEDAPTHIPCHLPMRSCCSVPSLPFSCSSCEIAVVDMVANSIRSIDSLPLPLSSPLSGQNNPSVPPLSQSFRATPPTIIVVGIVDSFLAIAPSSSLVSTRKDAHELRQHRFSQAQRRKGHRCSHPEQHRGTTIQLTNVPCTGTLNHTTTPTPPAASLVSSPRWPRTTDQASFFTTPILHTRLNGK